MFVSRRMRSGSVAAVAGMLLVTGTLLRLRANGEQPPARAEPAGASSPQPECEKQVRFVKDENGKVRWRCELRVYRFVDVLNPRSHELLISSDMTRFAYTALDARERARMVLDGVAGEKYKAVEEYVFSPDSKSFAYTAAKGEKERVVTNGQVGRRYNFVSGIVFSPNSHRMAYATSIPDGIVLDGRWLGPYDAVESTSLQFSPDSRHFAYAARNDRKCRLYLDDKEVDRFDRLDGFSLRFTADSRTLAYAYEDDGKCFVKFGAQRHGPFEEVDSSMGRDVAGDSTRMAFAARQDRRWFLYCGDRRFGPYTGRPCPRFSPDAKHLAYVAGVDKRATVFLDEQRLGDYDEVRQLQFSPDSQHLAWIAGDQQRHFLVIDGRREDDNVQSFYYSPDGSRLVRHVTTEDNSYGWIQEQNRRGKTYEGIGEVRFSRDSRHLAYWCEMASEFVLVVDGLETLRFRGEELGLQFVPDNHLRGVVVQDLAKDEDTAEPGDFAELKAMYAHMRIVLLDLVEQK